MSEYVAVVARHCEAELTALASILEGYSSRQF